MAFNQFEENRKKSIKARKTKSSNSGYLGEGSDFNSTFSNNAGYLGEGSDFNNNNSGNNNSGNNNNSGIDAFNFNNAPGGGEGSGSYNATTAAQTMLGDDYYNKAMKFMSPQELNDQIAKAQSYGRGINLSQFKSNLDKFEGFQNADGDPFYFDGKQYLSVNDPMITANAPTLAQLMGDIGGGIGDMMGAGADFIMGGGTMGKVLGGLKDKFSQGKNFVGDMMNPGDIRGRVNALSPEQQRMYYQLLPNMTYQQAFEQASGQAFARGGITSLN